MSNEEQQAANSLSNRQNTYMNLMKRIQDEQRREQQHRDLARLIQSLSNNPEVSQYLPSSTSTVPNQAGGQNQSSSKASNSKRKRGENDSKKTTNRSSSSQKGESEDNNLDETVRRLLYG